MFGFVGLFFLIIAYIVLITPYSRFFIPIDILASFLLTVHAVMIADIPFMVVNGLITIVLIIKFIKDKVI